MGVLRHWRWIVGVPFWLPIILKGVRSLLGFGGDADFILSHIEDPGWVGKMIEFLFNPPSWVVFPGMVIGACFIWWNVRRSRALPTKLTVSEQPVLPSTSTPNIEEPRRLTASLTHARHASPKGSWHNTRFVLNDPIVIHTAVVTAADNDKIQVFEVPYAPAHSFVETILEIDRHDERVKAGVVFARTPESPPWRIGNRNTRTSLRLPDDSLLAFRSHAEPEASVTTVRVRLASWVVGPPKA